MARHIEPLIPALRRYARALAGGDVLDADDLVQDCLEKAVKCWHQLENKEEARAWLFSILHNLAITRLQRAARYPPVVPIETTSSVASPALQEDNLHYQDILAALSLLSEAHKTLLLLIAVEDFSYAEAAEILDIPIGTVMSRLSRAREHLHEILSRGPEAKDALRSVTDDKPYFRRKK